MRTDPAVRRQRQRKIAERRAAKDDLPWYAWPPGPLWARLLFWIAVLTVSYLLGKKLGFP